MTNSPGGQPAPGWYEDPQQPTMLRWWDGGRWTNDIRPMDTAQPVGSDGGDWGLRPVADWMTENFRRIVAEVGSIFTLMVMLLMPASLLSSVGLWRALRDVVVTIDDSDSTPTFDVQGFSSPTLFGIAMVANIVLLMLFNISVVRLVMGNRFSPLTNWGSSLRGATAAFPFVFGWALAGTAAVMVLVFLFSLTVALVGAASAVLGLLVGVGLFLVAPVVLFGRYSMAFTSPMVAARGARNPLEVHRITRGHISGMIGRSLLLLVVATLTYMAGTFVTGPLSTLGGAETIDPQAGTIRFADVVGDNRELFILLQLMVSVVVSFAIVLWHVGMALLFEDLGGKLDPALRPDEEPA